MKNYTFALSPTHSVCFLKSEFTFDIVTPLASSCSHGLFAYHDCSLVLILRFIFSHNFHIAVYHNFNSIWWSLLSISFKTVLVVTNSLSCCLPGKGIICSILKRQFCRFVLHFFEYSIPLPPGLQVLCWEILW